MDEITRLEPANKRINYNVYTECLPETTEFIPVCNKLLNDQPVYVTQIMGYDCNPGYVRAKCLLSVDQQDYDNDFFNKYYDQEYSTTHTDLNVQCADKCK